VVETVYVESEWEPSDPLGETRFIHALAGRCGVPNAVVAQAWLDHPEALALLAEQAAFERVRSVRHKPGGPSAPAQVGSSRSLDERRKLAPRLCRAARPGPALRPADALVESAGSRAAGPRLSADHA
jgi:predicted TIM-barrel fold metal-dependent hydrolase